MKKFRFTQVLYVLIFFPSLVFAQDPLRFKSEIDTINSKYASREGSRELIVFTGSSSVRRWQNIGGYFPEKNIINTGFGGSQMSDLLYFADKAILRYKPVQVFVYEGDNDIAAGKKNELILAQADSLITLIHKALPHCEIVFLSAKPSPVRWKLKEQYLNYNTKLKELTSRNSYTKYLNLWDTLISESGRPEGSLFISDSLHINSYGYNRWAVLVGKVLK